MKYLFKKFWWVVVIATIINIPILFMGIVKSDKSLILKGDTSIVEDFVIIDSKYKSEGSFSSIFVISMDRSSILQNLLVSFSETSEISDFYEGYEHLSDDELNQMGTIQFQSSIMYSLITAYTEAGKIDSNINIEYSFDGYMVAYYAKGSDFRIGDKILGINGVLAKDDFDTFKTEFNSMELGDVLTVERGYSLIDITMNENNFHKIAGYAYYNINKETTTPSYITKSTNVGGPSGGLLQTLSLYNALVIEDITKGRKIAGTGTISVDGTVGEIGGIMQKIYTAFDDNVEVFLCPAENYEDALIAYNKLPNKERMRLYSVSSFQEALNVLSNDYLNNGGQ